MPRKKVLGVDLGTTNSVVSLADRSAVRVLADADGRKLTSSTVSFHPGGDVLVGEAARERRLVDARNTIFSVKRLIGRPFRSSEVQRAIERLPFDVLEGPKGGVQVRARGENYSLPEISAFVLRKLRAVAEHSLGGDCEQAVITVPANFNELQRTATRDAGRIAGLDVLRILNEPTAAALAYGFGTTRAERDERIAVYDLGGGTFDISILDLSGDVIEVLATAGDTYLGGDDVDTAVAVRMQEAFLAKHHVDLSEDAQAFERLRLAAEWLKQQLSTLEKAEARVEEVAYGAGGKALDLEFALLRAELDKIAFPLIGRTFDICEEAMDIAGIRPAQLDNVVLVGGQSRSPQVRRMVAEYFGREPLASVDPDQVVAQGAALQAYALSSGSKRKTGWRTTLSGPAQESLQMDDEPTRVGAAPTAPIKEREDPTLPGGMAGARDKSAGLSTTIRGVGAPGIILPEAQVDDEVTQVREPPTRPDHTQSWRPPPQELPPPPALPPVPIGRVELKPVAEPEVEVFLEEEIHVESMPPEAFDSVMPESEPPGLPTSSSLQSEVPGAPGVPSSLRPPPMEAQEVTGAPLLLDVTPHSLGVETAGGFTEAVIARNSQIPTEQTRVFTTSQDDQVMVSVRVCQGEDKRIQDNQLLGAMELLGLRRAQRGEVQIAVTFILDADGTLSVTARDAETKKGQQIRINLVGALSDDEVEVMRQRQSLFGGE